MCYPSRRKKRRRGCSKVCRISNQRRGMQQVAHMVQCHDDHHQAADDIDGYNSFTHSNEIITIQSFGISAPTKLTYTHLHSMNNTIFSTGKPPCCTRRCDFVANVDKRNCKECRKPPILTIRRRVALLKFYTM